MILSICKAVLTYRQFSMYVDTHIKSVKHVTAHAVVTSILILMSRTSSFSKIETSLNLVYILNSCGRY